MTYTLANLNHTYEVSDETLIITPGEGCTVNDIAAWADFYGMTYVVRQDVNLVDDAVVLYW